MASATDARAVIAQSAGYAGGLNLRDAINQLAPDEFRVGENGILDEKGGFTKRLGSQSQGTFGVGTDRVLSCYTFYRGASAPQVLIHTSGGKLYYTNDPTINPITWTQIATGLSTTARMAFETFNSKCYMSNGVDNYAAWDGTTYTTFASAPKGKFLRLWKDTMWVSGVSGNLDRVYSSAAGDAETFPGTAFVDIAHGDGDVVTALGTDGLYLIVFKRNRVFLIYDPALFSNRTIDYEKGCEGHFTVIQFESEIYFLSRRGICIYRSDGPADFISVKLDPMFDPAILNLGALDSSYAYTYGTRVGWALPEAGSSTPTMQIEMYPRLIAANQYGYRGLPPFTLQRLPASTFTRFRSGSVEYLYGGSSTTNKFLYLYAPVGTDDGATFAAILETGSYNFNAPTFTKYLRRMRFLGRGQVTCQIKRNFQTAVLKTKPLDMSSGGSTWNPATLWSLASTWGPDSWIKEVKWHPDVYGRSFTIRFSDSSAGTGRRLIDVGSVEYSSTVGEWGIYGFTIDANILGVRD